MKQDKAAQERAKAFRVACKRAEQNCNALMVTLKSGRRLMVVENVGHKRLGWGLDGFGNYDSFRPTDVVGTQEF